MTVVIPCFNYASYLPAAVQSVLTQRGVEVDVVVVDDASTDDSLAIVQELAAGDSRIRVLANSTNRGPVATFNRGLAEADGEFLVRLDADDLLTPGSLSRAVAVMQALPAVGLVYGHPLHFDGAELPRPRTRVKSWLLWRGGDWLAARCAAGTNVITSPEVLMRRSVVDIVGGQRDLAHTHDMEMWFRIAAHSDVAYITGTDQAWHREHDASLSLKAEDPLIILREIDDAFNVLFDGWSSAALDPAPLRSAARRGVAAQALASARTHLDRGIVSETAVDLMTLAERVDPEIMASTMGRDTSAARWRASVMPRALAVLFGLLPRLHRKFRFRAESRRWARTGVYERVSFRPRHSEPTVPADEKDGR